MSGEGDMGVSEVAVFDVACFLRKNLVKVAFHPGNGGIPLKVEVMEQHSQTGGIDSFVEEFADCSFLGIVVPGFAVWAQLRS